MRVSVPPSEQKSGFALCKPGQYDLRVAKISEQKGPKGPYLKVELEVLGATEDADGQPLAGPVGRIFDVCTLAEGSRWRLGSLLKAAGLDPEDADTDDLIGQEVPAFVEIEKDEKYPAKNVVKKYIDKK